MSVDIAADRVAANRAEIAAGALRRVSKDLERLRPGDERGKSILDGDVREAISALERLVSCAKDPGVKIQADYQIRSLQSNQMPSASQLRSGASEWDAWAAEIDP